MKSEALKKRLLRYLKKIYPQKISKGELCDIARQVTGATGEHTGRRMRELENEGLVSVEYRKGHAWYRATLPKQVTPYFVNGIEVSRKVEY